MKNILLKRLFILLLIPGLGAFLSCNKNGDEKCEDWEYQDICTPKVISAKCVDYVNKVANICGAELDDAHEGRTSLIFQNSTLRIDRHYVKQMK